MAELPDISFDIVIGAICGVLAALILLVLGNAWTHTVLPLLKRWTYRGAKVAGAWKGLGTGHTPASGEWSEVALALKQDAFDLRGTMMIRHRSATHSFALHLQVVGRIAQGHVTLSLSPASRKIATVVTALLKIDSGGRSLNGQLLYRDAFLDTVEAINLSVHRSESIALPRLRPAPVVPAAQGAPVQQVEALVTSSSERLTSAHA